MRQNIFYNHFIANDAPAKCCFTVIYKIKPENGAFNLL